MMCDRLLLLADAAAWISGFLPLVVMVIVVVYFAIDSNRKAQRTMRKPNVFADPAQAERARAAAASSRGPKPVRNEEIEEFLRRAAQQRGEMASGGRAISGRPGAARPPAKPERLAGPATQRPARLVRSPEPEAAASDRTPRSTLSDGVSDRLSTKQFEARVTQRADDLAKADRQRELELKQKFDQRLGTLAKDRTPVDPVAPEPSALPELDAAVAGFFQPDSLKQAFLFSEIFRRPEERW